MTANTAMSHTPLCDRAQKLLDQLRNANLDGLSQQQLVEVVRLADAMIGNAVEIQLRATRELGKLIIELEGGSR
jgi:hypothetical protein